MVKILRRKETFDKAKIQCYRCDNFGHFAKERCSKNNDNGKESEESANMAHDKTYSKIVMLMVTTIDDISIDEIWYMDTGCSDHMIGNTNCLVNFDPSRTTNVRLADVQSVQKV